jgi:hypothetical protein
VYMIRSFYLISIGHMAGIFQVSDISVVYHIVYSEKLYCEDHTVYSSQHSIDPHCSVYTQYSRFRDSSLYCIDSEILSILELSYSGLSRFASIFCGSGAGK